MRKLLALGVILVYLIISPLFSQSGAGLIRVGQWKHEGSFSGDFYSFINQDNNLVAALGKGGNMIITPNKIIQFALRGQGPNELIDLKTAFLYKGDLAMVEQPNKIKVFTQKGESYYWKETKWLKRGMWVHFIKEGLFYDGKIFFAGMEGIKAANAPIDSIYKEFSYVKVYADNGDSLKQLIKKSFNEPTLLFELKYHLAGYHSDRVFFLHANELKVHVISTKTLEVLKEVQLEAPPFYQKMPKNFYSWEEDKKKDVSQKKILHEEWETGYSSVQEMVVEGKYLLVQIRTAQEKMKKFALLFYNLESLKLEKTVLLDDFLLDTKDGKYYCYANGMPGIDEDTDDCIINIYRFESKK